MIPAPPPGSKKKRAMKHIKYIIPLLLMAITSIVGLAFTAGSGEAPEAEANYTEVYWRNLTAFSDTITDAETLTYSLGSFNRPIAVEVQIAADSLSGTLASTVTLEQSINGSDWFVVDTETLSGVTVRLKATGDVLGGTLRVRSVSTGTQSALLRMDAIVTDSQPTQ